MDKPRGVRSGYRVFRAYRLHGFILIVLAVAISLSELGLVRVFDEAGPNNVGTQNYFHGPLVGPAAQTFLITQPWLSSTNLVVRVRGMDGVTPTLLATLHDASGTMLRRSRVNLPRGNTGGGWYSIDWSPAVKTVPGSSYRVTVYPIVDTPGGVIELAANTGDRYSHGTLYRTGDLVAESSHDLRIRNLTEVTVARAFLTRINFVQGGAIFLVAASVVGLLGGLGVLGAMRRGGYPWYPAIATASFAGGLLVLFFTLLGSQLFVFDAIAKQAAIANPDLSRLGPGYAVVPISVQLVLFSSGVTSWAVGTIRQGGQALPLPKTWPLPSSEDITWLFRTPAATYGRQILNWYVLDLTIILAVDAIVSLATAAALQIGGMEVPSQQAGSVGFFFLVLAVGTLSLNAFFSNRPLREIGKFLSISNKFEWLNLSAFSKRIGLGG